MGRYYRITDLDNRQIMKLICTGCGVLRTADNTHRNRSRKSGLSDYCKKCSNKRRAIYCKNNKTKIKESQANYIANNKTKTKKRLAKYGLKMRKILLNYTNALKVNGCGACGYKQYPIALDFHHLDGDNDNGKISNMKTIKKVANELETKRIVILCSNCHRAFHAGNIELPIDIVICKPIIDGAFCMGHEEL